uniref:Interferon related developmental regulator 2 n=1 Tax=Myotis myotis TaxID=51298 RepID=A0A7J7UCL7_MYOMY|nr:interferon related developmental regulator 2 [Myotis myotis]
MPRARKGSAPRKGGQRRRGGAQSSAQADSGSSEDEAASEARSTTSDCPSLLSTAAEDSLGGDAVDEQSQQEDLEEKLKEYVDCLTDKSAKTRQGALENLRLALASRLLPDFLLERSLTLADALEKCLKKGKAEEQALAAALLGLLCVQLGPGPKSEELFHGLQPLLVSVLTDAAASPSARLHEDLTYGDMDALCGALRTLATDSNKYRAKADRRRQRATFRAVLHFIEGGECEEETIRFGLEVLYVDSWARRRVYAAFKDVLGSGMHHHLQVGRRQGGGTRASAAHGPRSLSSPPRTTSCSATSLAWAPCWCWTPPP